MNKKKPITNLTEFFNIVPHKNKQLIRSWIEHGGLDINMLIGHVYECFRFDITRQAALEIIQHYQKQPTEFFTTKE